MNGAQGRRYGLALAALAMAWIAALALVGPLLGEMAGAIEALVAQGLPADHGRGALRLRIERDATSFHVDVTAPHLPLTPPPVGLMDRVSVHADPGGTRHRFTRHLPGL